MKSCGTGERAAEWRPLCRKTDGEPLRIFVAGCRAEKKHREPGRTRTTSPEGCRNVRELDPAPFATSNVLPVDPSGDSALNEFKTINGTYTVQPDGTVDLGPEYGSVQLQDATIQEVRERIIRHLRKEVDLANPKVAVSFLDVHLPGFTEGEHRVREDGTVSLGAFGNFLAAGKTEDELRVAVNECLGPFIFSPAAAVDVTFRNAR